MIVFAIVASIVVVDSILGRAAGTPGKPSFGRWDFRQTDGRTPTAGAAENSPTALSAANSAFRLSLTLSLSTPAPPTPRCQCNP